MNNMAMATNGGHDQLKVIECYVIVPDTQSYNLFCVNKRADRVRWKKTCAEQMGTQFFRVITGPRPIRDPKDVEKEMTMLSIQDMGMTFIPVSWMDNPENIHELPDPNQLFKKMCQ